MLEQENDLLKQEFGEVCLENEKNKEELDRMSKKLKEITINQNNLEQYSRKRQCKNLRTRGR